MGWNALSVARVFAFAKESLEPRSRILEVGCGNGELALELASAGHEVVGVDLYLPDELPRHPRLEFIAGDFLSAKLPGSFGAVLFTASLHHINPLDAAVARARSLLGPGGRLILDEFDIDAPDRATLDWFEATRHRLTREGLFGHKHHRHHHEGPDLETRWRERHQHPGEPPLHRAAVMLPEIEKRFRVSSTTRGAYLYRYLLDGLENSPRGKKTAEELIAEEERGIRNGSLRAVGLRVVAEPA